MTKEAGELDYTEEEFLRPGRPSPASPAPVIAAKAAISAAVEIHVISRARAGSIAASAPDTTRADDADPTSGAPAPVIAAKAAISAPASASGADDVADSDENSAEDDEPTVENTDDAVAEARLIAGRIKNLMRETRVYDDRDGFRPVSYGDIAVLLRATKTSAPVYRDELTRLGIPAYSEAGSAYFEKYEISVMLSLLKIIDNPLQDIPLFTVMLSPVFSFTAEETTIIRYAADVPADAPAASPAPVIAAKAAISAPVTPASASPTPAPRATPHKPLYDCLEDVALRRNLRAEPDGSTVEKALSAVTSIGAWRRLSVETPVSVLIWKLMHETDFYLHACAMPGGGQRRANLLKLFEYARTYEKISYKGIFNFIRFIDKLIERGEDLAEAKLTGAGTDAVRIMSIHKSKGLEFPVVFLAGCGRKFNMRDSADQMLLHRELGFGPNYVDTDRRIIDETIAKKLLRVSIRREALSEEMRILYVALTRAKNKLFLIGTLADADQYVQKLEPQLASSSDPAQPVEKLPADFVLKADRYLYWIMASFASTPDFPLYIHNANDFALALAPSSNPVIAAKAATSPATSAAPSYPVPAPAPTPASPSPPEPPLPIEPLPDGFYSELDSRLSWTYPYDWLGDIPRKVSVSEMADARTAARRFTSAFTDDEDDGLFSPVPGGPYIESSDELMYESQYMELPVPDFMSGKREFTPAQIGTFTHLVLEKLDFTQGADAEAIEELISRLVACEFLTPEHAAAVDRKAIMNFFASEAGRLASASENLNRETMFTVKLSLDEYYTLLSRAATPAPSAPAPVPAPPPASAPVIAAKAAISDELPFVLMQGSVDCWFDTHDGIVLIDYKTGLTARKDISGERLEKYKRQLDLYALALTRITGRAVSRRYLCLLSADICLEL